MLLHSPPPPRLLFGILQHDLVIFLMLHILSILGAFHLFAMFFICRMPIREIVESIAFRWVIRVWMWNGIHWLKPKITRCGSVRKRWEEYGTDGGRRRRLHRSLVRLGLLTARLCSRRIVNFLFKVKLSSRGADGKHRRCLVIAKMKNLSCNFPLESSFRRYRVIRRLVHASSSPRTLK